MKVESMMRSWSKTLIIIGIGIQSAFADVVLAPPIPPPPLARAGENYPESRFGSPPGMPDLGGASSTVDRRPAGLEFVQSPGEVKARPVIADQSTPRTLANTNPLPNSSSRTGVQEVSVIAGDLGFFPKTLFVTRDIPVRLYVTGASKRPLCIMMDSFQVRKQIRTQQIEEINFVPKTPGKYRFYCPVNGMEGTLLVKELSSSIGESQDAVVPGVRQLSSRGE